MINILSIELNKLTRIDENINESFIENIFAQIPMIGKKHEKYYIINNNLTLHNADNSLFITKFNVFLQMSVMKGYKLIQLLK